MSSIIVLDSSDEEGGTVKKKSRIGPKSKTQKKAPPAVIQSQMARVNPVKAPNSTVAVKKNQPPMPNDNFKIQLPSKRPTQPTQGDPMPPEKRVRRVKPTTVMRSNDEEWIKRQITTPPQWNGAEVSKSTTTPTTSKNLVNSVKTIPIRGAKSPTAVVQNLVRPVQNNANQNNAIQSPVNSTGNFVRMAWNGKNQKISSPPVANKNFNPTSLPPMINKNITTTLKEQPKSLPIPPVINKNITATAKDPNIPSSLSSSPVFNKNSVTIRRIVVNDDRSKPAPSAKAITNIVNQSSANIKKVAPALSNLVDPLKISPNKTINNSSINTTQMKASSPTTPVSQTLASFRRTPQTPSESVKGYQHLPSLKKNDSDAKPVPNDPIAIVSTSPTMLYSSPGTVRKMVNVELPTKPTAALTMPVISKVFSSGVPQATLAEQQPLLHFGTSVITKNKTKPPEPKMSPPVVQKPPPAIMNRPSGLIVTPITCNIATSSTITPSYSKLSNSMSNPTRVTSKQSKASLHRARAIQAAQAEQLASIFGMFPPGGYMGNHPQMMYDMDPSGGAFINPACLPNRPMRSMEVPSFPTMSSPGFSVNYPNFSGGSITPVMSPGPGASPTYNSGRSSKSPVTSTVTRSASATRSPAGFMGMSIDVDQPMPPMSPPVYNMNHVPFNGDPFNFMRNPHNIPSPSFSPVRSTRSPSNSGTKSSSKAAKESAQYAAQSGVMPRDLDSVSKNSFGYHQAPNLTKSMTSTPSLSNGPIISLDNSPKSQDSIKSPTPIELFKSAPISLGSSPAQSDGSSITEVFNNTLPSNGKGKQPSNVKENNDKKSEDNPESKEVEEDGDGHEGEDAEEEEEEEPEEEEPLNPEFEALLKTCREADSSEDMERLIEKKLVRYYYSVHPDFVKSRGFKKAVLAAAESIEKNKELVYYHLRPVVEELKARKKCKSIVMTNDEMSAAAAEADKEGIEDKVRNRQIKRLNKGLYILTRKIHKLEADEVDLDDENSTYLIVERYKKRACEIYDKICDLTGESKHALRQVKKPITFKETDYPKFNKVVETFVNKTKEFPDFFDVLRMLEFCNDRYSFGLLKEEMTSIAQGAFIKIGKLLQSRRKADLYETVSHFTSDLEDPAENDPILLAKLTENERNQTSISSVLDKYAREQVRRKADLTSTSGSSSEATSSEEESFDEEHSKKKNNNNKTIKKIKEKPTTSEKSKEKRKKKNKDHDKDRDKEVVKRQDKDKHPNKDHDENKDQDKDQEENKHQDKDQEKNKNNDNVKEDGVSEKPQEATTNGTDSPRKALPPPSAPPKETSPTLPLASTSAAFRTSPPHAFESPEASPRPGSLSPLLPSCTTSSLKILSVTSLNENAITSSVATSRKNNEIVKPAAAVAGSADEIIISDEDL